MTAPAQRRLLALSDLHVAFPENRKIIEDLRPESEGDWLLLAGDAGELKGTSNGRCVPSANGSPRSCGLPAIMTCRRAAPFRSGYAARNGTCSWWNTVAVLPDPVGAENWCHLGRCSADHGWLGPAFWGRAAGLGPSGGGMIFGLWA